MNMLVRNFMLVVAALQVVLAVVFFIQPAALTSTWPFPGTTPLTYIFLSSIFAAAAASTAWPALTRADGAFAGIALDYIIILVPLTILSINFGSLAGVGGAVTYGIICLVGVLFGLALFFWSVRLPIPKDPPLPALVRWSFVIFIIALWVVSVQLILGVPNIIPWKVTPELSALIGWIFVGASAYFVYTLLRPSWHNAAGQLAGFLAYDVVLIVPFLQRLPTIAPEFKVNLYVYTAVVVYSGLLAVYFLFIHRPTRIFR